MGASIIDIDSERVYAKITRRLVPFLFLCYICAYLDRVNVGFAKLQMSDALGFSDAVYGLGAGIFFIGYFLFEIPSNLLLHRYGARRCISRIMILWGIISISMLWVETPAMFYFLRFLLGAAEAGFFPGVILYLTYWFPLSRRGRVVALFATAVAIASVIGAPLSSYIMQAMDGVRAWAGWQWLFFLEGLPSVVFGIAAFLYLDDRVADARWLTEAEKARIAADLATDIKHVTHTGILEALQAPRVWLMSGIYFAFVMGLYGLNFWLPTIVRDLGYESLITIGYVSAIPFGAAAISMVIVGRSADRHQERRWHIVIPALLGAVGLAASVMLSGTPVLAIAALTLATCGVLSALPQCWSLATTFLGGGAAAAGIALINSFGNLSGFVGPYAIGWIKDATGDTANGVYLLAASVTIGALLVLRVPVRRTPN
jgi:MFS family permease